MERRFSKSFYAFDALEAGEAFRFVFPRLPDDFYVFPQGGCEAEDDEDLY